MSTHGQRPKSHAPQTLMEGPRLNDILTKLIINAIVERVAITAYTHLTALPPARRVRVLTAWRERGGAGLAAFRAGWARNAFRPLRLF